MKSQNDIIYPVSGCQVIKALMKQRSVTQEELGRLVGLAQPAVSKRLSGERRWQVDELVALSRAWGVSVDELTGGPGREGAS